MRIASRTKTIAFFITLGVCLIGVAIALNVSWIVLKWREVGALVLGIILFAFIIAGVVLNTVFLVREIRLDADTDVDLDDFGIFQRCFSGHNQLGDVHCNGN